MPPAPALVRCPHCGELHPREAKACPMTGRPMPGAFIAGQVLDGKYRIVRHIADGGMGAVYEAEHLHIGRTVALKTLHAELAKNEEIVARFQMEARAASAIGHEHIVDMIDMGRTPDGALFIVMEFLRGENLAERLQSLGGRMPVGRAAHVIKQVLEALVAAHAHRIVHRDLKPENVFLIHRGTDPDFVKVLDFGISKMLADPKLTQTGLVLGTPYYMAPEQARGEPADHRADVYACGAMLYRLVTGRVPFDAPNFNALLFEIAGGRYTPPRAIVPEIPQAFEQIIMWAMALDLNYRYSSADHFLQALAPYAEPVVAAPARPATAPASAIPASTRTPSVVKAFVATAPPLDLGGAPPATPAPSAKGAGGSRFRLLPVTVGAGIAVGVFAGLLVIKLVGSGPATPGPTSGPAPGSASTGASSGPSGSAVVEPLVSPGVAAASAPAPAVGTATPTASGAVGSAAPGVPSAPPVAAAAKAPPVESGEVGSAAPGVPAAPPAASPAPAPSAPAPEPSRAPPSAGTAPRAAAPTAAGAARPAASEVSGAAEAEESFEIVEERDAPSSHTDRTPRAHSSASAPPAAPAVAIVTFRILPPEAAPLAKITVDDVVVEGGKARVEVDPKRRIRIQVEASGYLPWSKRLSISSDTTLDVELKKKPIRPSGSGPGGSIDL